MRFWIILALVITALAYTALLGIGSAMALAEIGSRPILALARADGTQRIVVPPPGQPAKEGEARPLGGEGVLFGYSFTYSLPDGELVQCAARFRWLGCSNGWLAERQPAPG